MSPQAEALKNEGNARKAAGDLHGALHKYRAALEIDATYTAALYNLGVTCRELRQFAESEAAFRRLLALAPDDVDALFNLAALLRQGQRLDEAVERVRRALALAPGDARLWLYLGQIGIERYTDESVREAIDALRRAISLQPDLADAHHRLGAALDLDGRHDDALAAYGRAGELEPSNTTYAAALLVQKQRLCDWRGLDALHDQVRRAAAAGSVPPVEPFDLLSIPSTRAEQLAASRHYSRAIEAAAGPPLAAAAHASGKRC
ncbi:MAG: tetratricopeptide repeat protein, partial [Clostridia bacterium]